MNIDVKKFLRLAGLVGAASTCAGAAFGAIAYARPLMDSDWPGPFTGRAQVDARVSACEAKVIKLAQNFDLQQRHIERSDQTQLFLAQGFWTQQLAIAQDRLRRHPEDVEAREHMITAQQQLETIARLLNQK